jgi:hypothetical protein
MLLPLLLLLMLLLLVLLSVLFLLLLLLFLLLQVMVAIPEQVLEPEPRAAECWEVRRRSGASTLSIYIEPINREIYFKTF